MDNLSVKPQPDINTEEKWNKPDRIGFSVLKRTFDIGFSLVCLIPLLVAIPILLIANKRFNPGPLFFCQPRMGRGCKQFKLVKFRTMVPAAEELRGHDDPLEVDRITPLGAWLRRTRIDELPQVINILRGEMSLIGPRPDVWRHALIYCEVISGYRDRHRVRPGITGLAQARIGYAEGVSATRHKARADLVYICNMNLKLDLMILGQTVIIMLKGFGIDAASIRKFRWGTLSRSPGAIEGTLATQSQNASS